MPNGILIAVAVVVVIAAVVITRFATISTLRKNAESKIGNAEAKAREIIDDAVKTAETTKKEALLLATLVMLLVVCYTLSPKISNSNDSVNINGKGSEEEDEDDEN